MTTIVSEHPLATALARFQTQQRSDVTNLVHTRVQLDNFSRLVCAQLDGVNDRAALIDFLVELAEAGKISLPTAAQMPNTADGMRKMLADALEITLQQLASLALLVA